MPSKSIHVAANGNISFFFMLYVFCNIVYVCTYTLYTCMHALYDCMYSTTLYTCMYALYSYMYVFSNISSFFYGCMYSTAYMPHFLYPFICPWTLQFSSVAQSCLTLYDLMDYSKPSFPVPPRACSNSCPLRQWCHPTTSSSVVPFSFCLRSFPASRSFQISQLFTSGGQSIGVSASTSVLPMNIQDCFPLG